MQGLRAHLLRERGDAIPSTAAPPEKFDQVIQMAAEGMSKAQIARVVGISPQTVARWLERAARHAALFRDRSGTPHRARRGPGG